MEYGFLEKLFGKDEEGNTEALTFDQLVEKIKGDDKLKLVDLGEGGYVSKEKFDAKVTELSGIKEQLKGANEEIKSYKDMDIDGIKAKATEWEDKYNTDTKALNDKLSAQERAHQEERFFDKYKFSSIPARKGIKEEFDKKEFKLDENGIFLGAEDFMNGLMQNDDYKAAFIIEQPKEEKGTDDNEGQQAEEPQNKPYFSAGTNSQTQEPKGSMFNFGFSGVRKRD